MGVVRIWPAGNNDLSGIGLRSYGDDRFVSRARPVPLPLLVEDRSPVSTVAPSISVVPLPDPGELPSAPAAQPSDDLVPFEPTLPPAGADVTTGMPTFIDVAQAQASPVAKWGLIALGVGVFFWSLKGLKKPKRRQSRRRKR